MKVNVGNTDRMLRLIVGVVLLGLGLFGPWGLMGKVIASVIGAVMLVVAATRSCPLYTILGKSTCQR